ncbi:reverse transcriptase domain-containing protein [Tanacetum coccineum]
MYRDAATKIQDCTQCQAYSTAKPPNKNAITFGSTWPFSHWGIDILGPLPVAPQNLKFLFIDIEHLTKWVEVKPVNAANERQAENFAWEHVICRFGVPQAITLKDDKHFREEAIIPIAASLIYENEEPIVEGKAGSKGKRKWKAFGRSIKREWKLKCKPSSTFSSPHMEKREWQPLQSSLTSVYGGHALLNNVGGNLPPNGSVTPFICWIEDYPLPDGLKMPSHIGSYDEKGDPDNFLHLFEGAIRMQKWLMSVACHMFTYTLKDPARIWWNSQKADLPPTYKGLMEKTYTWVEAREVATNGISSDRRDSFERPKKSSWDNNRGQKNKDRFSPYQGPNHSLISNLSKSPRQILATERATKSFEPPPKMFESKRSRDTSNIKKEKAKSTDTPQGEGKKDKSIAPVEAPILMISREDYAAKNTVSESIAYKEEITIPPVTRVSNEPVIIEAAVFRRKVGRVYTDSGSTCEVIYEHCFEKLNPTIKATRVNTKTPLVGFSGKRSWSVGEVLLEITIGEHPLSRTETLNFVIVKSDSPHNMLLGRTTMYKMGIVVLTIHGAIKFHTKKGVEIVLLVGEAGEETKKARRTLTISKERIPSCDDTEEKNRCERQVSGTDGNHREAVSRAFQERVTKFVESQCGHLRMDTCRHDRNSENHHRFRLKCFLDAYKGYHQIQITEGDEDKIAFFVWEGVFCYQKMPFGLKTQGTFKEGMLSEIQETFERFRSINMKLNSKKCSFGVEEGLFLGHLITKQGIKANPMKIKAVTELEQPRALKDIQSLNRKLAAFNRFLSKGAERSLPFFKVLKSCKGKKKIHWTDEADKAFKEIKKFVQALPTLTAPRAGETLTMYLVVSKESINAALFAKRSEGQIPIYFISRVLQGAELNYPALEKLILALVHAARRLRRYFQAHTIMVPIGTPIKQALTGPEKTGRVAKWAIELGEHDIVFLKRDERETPADFLPEIPFDDSEKKVKEKEVSDPSNEWKPYTDGASSPDGAGAGLMLIDPAVEHVRRNQNKKADALSKLASMTFEHLIKEVLVEVLAKRSIEEKEVLKVEIEEKRSWISPIQEYLLSGILPEDTKEARKIRIQVPQYKLIRGKLQKQFKTAINARNDPQ